MRRLSITLITLLLAACQTPAPRHQASLPDIRQALKESETAAQAKPPAPPPEVTAALMPPLKIELGQPEEQEKRFDIQVVDAPAREFFMGLVAGTPWNMVVHPDVGGKISLDLKNVTIDEVMETLRNVYGYEYEQTASGFHVLPIRLQSRIYQINYLNVKRNGNSEMRVGSGQMSQNSGGGDTVDNGGGIETQPSSKVVTESSSNFWSELRSGLRTLVGDGEGRSVVVSPQSGIVVVRAMPAEQREVAAYLRSLQSTLQRQVIIEAKIIEVQLDDGYRSGIDWGKLAGLPNSGLLTIGQTGGGSVLDSGVSGISGNVGNLDPAAYGAISSLAAQAFGGVFSAAIKTGSFAAFIELLKSQGHVQVLSSPRVATLNNQKAVIKVGQDEFFVTDVSTTTVTGATTTSTPDVTLTPFFSGIALDVTPQIDTRGGVTLHIHPSVSEVTDQSKTFTIDNKTQTLPLAQSRVRESDSIVYARNGEIVVIGGLMQESRHDQRASVPGAGDLPLFGSLFGHRREQTRKSELVILLRPLVIDGPAAWRQEISATARRIDRLGRAPNGKEVF